VKATVRENAEPTLVALSNHPEATQIPPLPDEPRITLADIGKLGGIASGIALVMAAIVGYILEYRYRFGESRLSMR